MELAAVLCLLSLLCGVVVWVLATRRIPESSDQAVVGLMALHIARDGEHPVFYWGSTYAGSLEAHGLALAFRLFGASTRVYRGCMVGIVLAIAVGVWALTRRTFGARAALVGLAYLSLPPFFFLYKGLTSDGHYASVQLIALGVVASALWQHERRQNGQISVFPLGALGFTAGLGLWASPISPPFSIAAVAWLVVCGDLRPVIRSSAVLAAGALLGASPWWAWNLQNGWASVSAPETGAAGLAGFVTNLRAIAATSAAVLTGAQQVNQGPSSFSYPGAWPIAGILLLFVLGLLARRETRGDRRVHLFAVCAVLTVAAAATSGRFVAGEPRFLVTLYVFVAPLLGAALGYSSAHRASLAIGAIAFAGLLTTNALSLKKSRTHDAVRVDGEVTGPLEELLTTLERRGVRRLYANYWTAYRIAFESRERIIATPLLADDGVRYPRYGDLVASTPDPAFVFLPPRSDCFETYLRETGGAVTTTRVGAFTLFEHLPRGVLDLIRRAGTLPLPIAGHAVTWELLEHPSAIPAGGRGRVRMRIRNDSSCAWLSSVHLGLHWLAREPGATPVEAPFRAFPFRVDPGESGELAFAVPAPRKPGVYAFDYDLVHEVVTWFSAKGGRTLTVNVRVDPPERTANESRNEPAAAGTDRSKGPGV